MVECHCNRALNKPLRFSGRNAEDFGVCLQESNGMQVERSSLWTLVVSLRLHDDGVFVGPRTTKVTELSEYKETRKHLRVRVVSYLFRATSVLVCVVDNDLYAPIVRPALGAGIVSNRPVLTESLG